MPQLSVAFYLDRIFILINIRCKHITSVEKVDRVFIQIDWYTFPMIIINDLSKSERPMPSELCYSVTPKRKHLTPYRTLNLNPEWHQVRSCLATVRISITEIITANQFNLHIAAPVGPGGISTDRLLSRPNRAYKQASKSNQINEIADAG